MVAVNVFGRGCKRWKAIWVLISKLNSNGSCYIVGLLEEQFQKKKGLSAFYLLLSIRARLLLSTFFQHCFAHMVIKDACLLNPVLTKWFNLKEYFSVFLF